MADETADKKPNGVQEIEVDGVKFTVDTDRIDDVESLDYIDRIERNGNVAAVLPLLKLILGNAEFEKIKAAFSQKDAEAHAAEFPDDKEYKGRFRIKKLQDVYLAIIEKFDPKD